MIGATFTILVNGIERTHRDKREFAIDAARYLKARHRGDIIEILDRAMGVKSLMLEDGRLA